MRSTCPDPISPQVADASDEHVGDDSSAGEPFAEGGEGPFEYDPAKEDISATGS